jgi:type IX secretion system PorP/SprF family membrane protein
MKLPGKLIFSVTVMLAFYGGGFAQQDPIASQYHLNPAMINPAYSGLYNSFMVNANSRLQWMGMQGNPFSNFVTVTTSIIEKKVGGGLLISQDNIGITSTTEIAMMYAYRIEVDRSLVSLGLQGGFVNVRQKHNDLTLSTLDDPNFPATIQNSMKPNFGAGLSMMGDSYYIGLSVPRLMNVKFDDGLTNSTQYKRHYYLSAAFIKDLTPFMKLKPVVLLRHVEGAPFSYDIGANVLWNHKFWFGAYTRNFVTQGALFQLLVNQTVRLGYSIEVPTAAHLEARFISHEIVLGIDLSLFKSQEAFLRYF